MCKFSDTAISDSMAKLLKLAMRILLLFLSTLLMGVSPLTHEEVFVRAGEMASLVCKGHYGNNTNTTHWKSDTNQEFNNMSAAEQRQMGVVVYENNLVILNASVNHQGNYSCSLENFRGQFTLRVYAPLSGEYEEKLQYPSKCIAQKFCTLNCPDVNTPAVIFTSSGITWHKVNGESFLEDGHLSKVEMKDGGIYTCTRSYLYGGQIYNMTFIVALDVQQHENPGKAAVITSPQEGEVIQVELGSRKEIDCEAVTYSCHESLFWLDGKGFPYTEEKPCKNESESHFKMKVTLVIKEVTESDLLKNYTCKLEAENQVSTFVKINLIQKARPSYTSLVVCIICLAAVTVVVVVVYVKFKVDIALFLRGTLSWCGSASDGKSYDAFLMCYESNIEDGLNSQDRKWLESMLEDRFGYTLCLHDRDVLPGNPVAEAVLDCVERSRTVVLVPSSPGPDPGSGLLSAIHAALVERQTHLVFINTESTDASRSGSLPEALQLLSEAGDHVTWKGMKSMHPSSSFCKRLRYYLPAPQCPPKINLLPQTDQGVTTQYNV
ncbi:interleukin-18 receptor 1-like isoform X2 [Mugil cephalus]|uniref:interleukin-18 receptor 1-like isoform X2 n=1 Tax=Mugil cephalus TaxID=48193 RepID=UPI001FB7C371|nr:interleukin-18 receptor 1-like isoform X2 [Mugil cephalus]